MSAETVITPPSQVAAPPEPRRMAHGTRHRAQSRVFRIGRWVVIIGFLIATLVPFYYMVLLSVKPIGSLLQNPASLWVKPSEFTLQTYVNVLSSTASGGQGFGRFLLNSGVVALASGGTRITHRDPRRVRHRPIAVHWSAVREWRLPGRLSSPRS